MKTNFTNGSKLLMAVAVLAVTLSSCKKEEEDTTPDITGKYTLTSAILVDGDNSDSDAASNLVILNGLYDPQTQTISDAVIPAGDNPATNPFTLGFVNAILKGAAPCTDSDTDTWTYLIDIQSGGALEFDCTSEGISSEDLGNWVLTGTTELTLVIASESLGGSVTVTISDLEITDTTLSGTIDGFPMVKDALNPIGLDNLQAISIDIVITKA